MALMRFLVPLALFVAAPCAAAPLVVYDDVRRNDFVDYGWAPSRNYASTAVVRTGTNAIAWTPVSFEGVFMHRDAGIDVVAYVALRGWVNGGAGTNQDVRVCLIAGGAPVRTPCPSLSDYVTG